MAESSDHSNPKESSSSSFSNQRSNKPGTKRLFLTLSVLFSFLSGFPFLLKSTEIYRSPLPFASIASLSSRLHAQPLSSPCRFHTVFLQSKPHSDPDRLSLAISQHLDSKTSTDRFCGGCGNNHSVSVTVESVADGCVRSGNAVALWRCGAVNADAFGAEDESVDELLEGVIGTGGSRDDGFGGLYTVVVVEKEDEEEVRIMVGKHRHAWIVGKVQEADAINIISEIFVKFFMKGGRDEGELPEGEGEFIPVGLDGSVILSFSLLNADPNDWIYDWELQKVDKRILAPIMEALAPIANISVESQVLYHTPKSSMSYWDDNMSSYVSSTSDLPFFVNSNEWHLDTSTGAAGRAKVLQFVVYVPSLKECPLLLQLPNGETSQTNGFISPMWGGVVVWNPPRCSKDSPTTHISRNTISMLDMQKIFQVIVGQLRFLFGFKSDYYHMLDGGRFNILASKRGFTEWELDVLYRRHACSNLLSCATTLESLSKLVQSLPRMIVTDEIGKQVKLSLEAAGLAQNNASLGVYDASTVSSRKAKVLAEDAFFHPSIMSISYSSIEHYFAIYMPFFAPVSLHVLLAAIKELKRYKRERAKYLSFLADKGKAS